jgi:hypothetical protein
MLASSGGWLVHLIHHSSLFALALLLGVAAWAWTTRHRSWQPLPRKSRIVAAFLLSLLPFAWWLAGQSLDGSGDTSNRSGNGLGIRTAESVNVALPLSTSFSQPDIRMVNGRKVLMLLPPARIEWSVDSSVRAIALGYGFEPTAYEQGVSDGADIFLELVDSSMTRPLFHRWLDPAHKSADRGRQDTVVVLPPLTKPAQLVLRTEAGPAGNNAWDWVYLCGFNFRRDQASALQQFPGFNRVPQEVVGDQIGLFQDDKGQPFLFIAAPASVAFDLQPQDHQVEVKYGFMRTAYADGGHTNGAILRMEIRSRSGQVVKLFEYYAKPVERETDRNLLHAKVTLPSHDSGDRLVIRLLPGDNNDASWDHTFIRSLSLE